MRPTVERWLLATGQLEPPASDAAESRLDVAVIFTSVEATIAALRKAGALASSLSARIVLIVPQVVPWPLSLTSPPVSLDFSEKRFRKIAAESPLDVIVRLYLCRDQWETLMAVLKPQSVVVLGGSKRWWPTSEKRLANKLRRAGYDVVLVERE